MSWETWAAEHYPGPAHEVPAEGALAHSLRKWEGLRPEVLKAHGLRFDSGWLVDRAETVQLSIDDRSCALCHHYASGSDCVRCPLAKARGGVSCDDEKEGEKLNPYEAFISKADPEPMIFWLKKAIEESGK